MREVEGAISREVAEYATSAGRIESYCRSWSGPVEVAGKSGDMHWLQLTFPAPASARGCFPERWGSHRFEPIGDMFFVPAGEVFMARSECRQQRSVACILSPEALREWFDGDPAFTNRQLQGCLNIVNPTLRHLLARLGQEVGNPGLASEFLLEAMTVEIGIELARHFTRLGESPSGGGLAPWQLRLIDDRLVASERSPSLSELARSCNISVRHLTRGFRASRGFSIGHCVAASRIERAKSLLKSDMCVKSIAYEMGFASPSNFSAAFRRATGLSPRQYRQSAAHAELTAAPARTRLH